MLANGVSFVLVREVVPDLVPDLDLLESLEGFGCLIVLSYLGDPRVLIHVSLLFLDHS